MLSNFNGNFFEIVTLNTNRKECQSHKSLFTKFLGTRNCPRNFIKNLLTEKQSKANNRNLNCD